MTPAPGTPAGAGPGDPAGPAGFDPSPAPPAGIDPAVRETVEQIVQAVRDGNDPAIRTLLAELAEVADATALLYLRERLYVPR
ncbi:hypothetical protein [Streptomyces virginiae]|uniref:hypothetical protein n=2 Tax=Streptomyces TaxID=1883 RepID=UPI000AB41CC2